MLYTSTNKVYGGMEDVAVELRGSRYAYVDLPNGADEGRVLDFHSPYGCSKGAADQYVRDYARIYGLKTVVFRQSCIYGLRQFGVEDQGWVAWFSIRAMLGAPVTIYGDGKQVRDMLFIDDLVDAFLCRGRSHRRRGGTGLQHRRRAENQMSLLDLVADLKRPERAAARSLTYADWRPGDQRIFVGDVRKAARELGWSARCPPAKGSKSSTAGPSRTGRCSAAWWRPPGGDSAPTPVRDPVAPNSSAAARRAHRRLRRVGQQRGDQTPIAATSPGGRAHRP